MENKKLYDYILKKFENKYNEEDDIENIILNQKNLRQSEISNNLNISSDKSLEWLNFFFNDIDLKELYSNNDRIRNLITIQAIYYLHIVKNLYLVRYRAGLTKVYIFILYRMN